LEPVANEAALGRRGRSLPSGRGRAGRAWSVASLRARPRWEGVVGRFPALTGWGLALVPDGLAVVPGISSLTASR